MADRKLTVILSGDSKGLTSALGQADQSAGKFGSNVQGMGIKAKAALVGVGLGVLKFGKDSVAAYGEAEESQKRLADAFERFPKLANSSQKALQGLNSELQKKTKYDDDNIASGQAVIAQFGVTGKQIESITPLLLDYASRTGKDIPAAAQDVGKALLGNAKALKNIGIKYTATGDTAKDFTNIQALLAKQVGGFAEKEGTTAAGKMAILRNQFGELEETVGSMLVPALTQLASIGLSVIAFFSGLPGPVKVALGVVAAMGGAIVLVNKAHQAWTAATQAWSAVTKIATGVQAAFNVVMSANPIMLVVLAIAVLAAGLVLAYTKVGWFRDFVDASFRAISTVVGTVVGFIQEHWQLLLQILTGPIGIAVGIIAGHWETIKGGVLAVKDFIVATWDGMVGFFSALPGRIAGIATGMWDSARNATTAAKTWIGDRISDIAGFFSGLPGKIKAAFSGLGDIIKAPFVSAFQAVKKWWNSTVGGFGFTTPNWLPFGAGGKSFHIPSMHTGGIVPGGLGNEPIMQLQGGEGVFTPEQMRALMTMAQVRAAVKPTGSNESAGFLKTLATGFTENDQATADEQRALDIRASRGLPTVQELYEKGNTVNGSYMTQFAKQLEEYQRLSRDGVEGVADAVASAFGITTSGSLVSAVSDGIAAAIAPQQSEVADLLRQILTALSNPAPLIMDGVRVGEVVLANIAARTSRNSALVF